MDKDENLHIIHHAVVADRLGKMRDKSCPPVVFRTCMLEIAKILAVTALSKLPTLKTSVETPLKITEVQRLLQTPPLIVPILRAGLGLSKGFEDILPECDCAHIGLYRDETTHRPVEYLAKLPKNLERPIFVCDPMLATGYSLEKALQILLKNGAKTDNITIVCLLCVPEGLAVIRKSWPNISIYTAALDDCLNEDAYIVPGLGDAGDRIFGTI
jgi:uracil phosphoribosyltransferase